jgi:hypothetical protein
MIFEKKRLRLHAQSYQRDYSVERLRGRLMPEGTFVFVVSFVPGFPPHSASYYTFSPRPDPLGTFINSLPANSLWRGGLPMTFFGSDWPNISTGMYELRMLAPQEPGREVRLITTSAIAENLRRENDYQAPRRSDIATSQVKAEFLGGFNPDLSHAHRPQPGQFMLSPLDLGVDLVVDPLDIGTAAVQVGYVHQIWSPPPWMVI